MEEKYGMELFYAIFWALFVMLQDEAPHLVNPLVEKFVARHSGQKIT